MAVERGPLRQRVVDFTLSRARIARGLAAYTCLHGDETPATLDVFLANRIHPVGIAEGMIAHPALQGPCAARIEHGHFIHTDGFFAENPDLALFLYIGELQGTGSPPLHRQTKEELVISS